MREMKKYIKNQRHVIINVGRVDKRRYQIVSNDSFFLNNEYLIAKITDYGIELSVPSLDYCGKMHKIQNHNHKGWRQFSIVDERIKTGRFIFDEDESTEDKVVIYFE